MTIERPLDDGLRMVAPERIGILDGIPQSVVGMKAEGLERLHTHLELVYSYASGGEETLFLGLDLFHLLLELKDGMQLSGVGEEGIFANLEIFTQRLATENARELHAWYPSEETHLYRVRVVPRDDRQALLREPL